MNNKLGCNDYVTSIYKTQFTIYNLLKTTCKIQSLNKTTTCRMKFRKGKQWKARTKRHEKLPATFFIIAVFIKP